MSERKQLQRFIWVQFTLILLFLCCRQCHSVGMLVCPERIRFYN